MYVTTFSGVRCSLLYDLYHPTSSHLKMTAFIVNYYCTPPPTHTHTHTAALRVLPCAQPIRTYTATATVMCRYITNGPQTGTLS